MSFDPGAASIRPHTDRPGSTLLLCGHCGSDTELRLQSIKALDPPSDDFVEAGYVCTACDLHYLRRADVAAVGAVLSRAPGEEDVLIFDGEYVHCGRPMHTLDSEAGCLNAVYTDRDPQNANDVCLTTRILRCSCGFQIQLPE